MKVTLLEPTGSFKLREGETRPESKVQVGW